MTLDATVNVPSIVTILLALIMAAIWLVRVEARVSAVERRLASAEAVEEDIRETMTTHHEEFHRYQLSVAQYYITSTAVHEIEVRLISEMGRMERRIELQVERLAKAVTE